MRIVAALLFVLLLATSTSLGAMDTWSAIVERLHKAVVPVANASDTMCTAFVINTEKKYVMTAAHCFDATLYVDGSPAKVVSRDPKKDFMVLVVPELGDLPALVLAKDGPKVGDEVGSFGYGYGLERPMFRVTHISDDNTYIPEEGIGGPLLVFDTAFVGGQSGGPVVNQAGEVVAIVQMASPTVGLGRSADEIRGKVGRFFQEKK